MQRPLASVVLLGLLLSLAPAWATQIGIQTIRSEELSPGPHGDLTLFLNATWPSMIFHVDVDFDQSHGSTTHQFRWQRDTGALMMDLRSTDTGANDGDLRIGGQLSQNSGFDLAETFRAGEFLEAGELVSVDPRRADRVLRSRGIDDRLVVGVVSQRPGVVMGGVPFSAEDLKEVWGEEALRAFEDGRADLEAEVRTLWHERLAAPGIGIAERELIDLAVHDEVMRRFYWRHFTPVALAGRVPVKVDASFGPILPGDPLAPSPIPGVAQRAIRPGATVGLALEGLAAGAGTVLMLVQRAWYGGETELALAARADIGRRLEIREARIESLTARIAELQQMVADLKRQAEARLPVTEPTVAGVAPASF